MKQALLIATVIAALAAIGIAQQPGTAPRRRGLDQIDLLRVSPSAEVSTVGVDVETFKLLEPLMGHTRSMEIGYKEFLGANGQRFTHEYFYKRFGNEPKIFLRSTFMIREINKNLSPAVRSVLDANDRIAKDMFGVIGVIYSGEPNRAQSDMTRLFEQFGIMETADYKSDREQLLSAMLRRLNANFGRLRVGN